MPAERKAKDPPHRRQRIHPGRHVPQLPVATPEDTLGAIIRRITAGKGLTLIPVAEGEKIVGIVRVQNLMTSMSLLAEQRKIDRLESGG